MKITNNIGRLILHDSHFENELRENNNMVVTFDWAKLENLEELGLNEVIILGQTKLKINGIKNEQLKAYYEGKNFKLIDFPKNIGKYWNEVQNTEINDNNRTLQLDGLFTKNGDNYWVEWSLNYESCEVEWNSYITLTEWHNGKLPNN